jgi:hypothetical protein
MQLRQPQLYEETDENSHDRSIIGIRKRKRIR